MNEIEYIALFLTPESKDLLLRHIKTYWSSKNHEYPNHFLDHITLWNGISKSDYDMRDKLMNQIHNHNTYVTVDVTAIGWSAKAFAFKVESDFVSQFTKTPHITIGTKEGVTPYHARFIDNWTPIEKIHLFTILGPKYLNHENFDFIFR